MRLPLSATHKRRDTPTTVFRPSELPTAMPKLIIFLVWCAHSREYWGDGLSGVTPCILVNTKALEEPTATILHPEAGGNTAIKKVDSYVLEAALLVQWDIPHTRFDFQEDPEDPLFSISFRPALESRDLLWDLVQGWETNQSLRQISATEHDITSQNVIIVTVLFTSLISSAAISSHNTSNFLNILHFAVTSLLYSNIHQER
jgi:hypothetical protein